MTSRIKPFQISGWTVSPCAGGFHADYGDENFHGGDLAYTVRRAQRSPRRADPDFTLDVDPVGVARCWHEELLRLGNEQVTADLVGALLERIDHYEKRKPSWKEGTPEDYDAWLRDLTPDDNRLRFYQWIGKLAVTEALDVVDSALSDDPREGHARHYHVDDVYALIELIDPKTSDSFPANLPIGGED